MSTGTVILSIIVILCIIGCVFGLIKSILSLIKECKCNDDYMCMKYSRDEFAWLTVAWVLIAIAHKIISIIG